MKKAFWTSVVILLFSTHVYSQYSSDKDSIRSYTQQLLDGVATGESEAWEKYLDDGCLITSEDGTVKSKQEFNKRFSSPRILYLKARETISEPLFWYSSNIIVFCYTANLFVDLYGQERVNAICQTDTWIKTVNGWRLIATMAMDKSRSPIVQNITAPIIQTIVGNYQLSNEYGYKIFTNNGKLYCQKTGKKEEELKCESGYVFFLDSNPRIRLIFLIDSETKITQLIIRRAGSDIILPKVD
jgi:hypothetical protein